MDGESQVDTMLAMTILVRDEELLLEDNLQYHLSRGVDFVIATDNRSADRTPEILKEYERRGVLEYIYEPGDDYSQDRWVTRMARSAAERGADWVFHVDADEFWWPEYGDSLKTPLYDIPEGIDGIAAPRSNFVYLGDNSDIPFYARQIYRERRSVNPLGNPLPPKVCHRATRDVQIRQGNHSFDIEGREIKACFSESFIVFHYPIHSAEQFKKKILTGGRAYERNERLRDKAGQTWTNLYREHQRDVEALDRYLKQKTLSEYQIHDGCETGVLVEDIRLRDYLEKLKQQPVV